jgi:ATP-binding cassette subfamily B protein
MSDARPRGRPPALHRRLLAEARPYRAHLAGLFAVSLLAAPLALLVPLPLQVTVDSVIGGRPLPAPLARSVPAAWQATPDRVLLLVAGLVLALTLLVQLQDLAAWAWRTWVGERLVLELRAKLFDRLQRLSLAWHDTKGVAESVYRVQSDADAIQSYVVAGMLPLASLAVRVVAMVVVTATIDLPLAAMALVGGPILFALTHLYRGRLRRAWKEARERDSAAMGVVQESLGALRVVKAFGREETHTDRYVARASESLRAKLAAVLAHGSYDLLVGLAVGVGTAAVLWIGAQHVREGRLTLGQLLLVMGYLSMLFQPLREIGSRLADLQRSLASAERVFALIDEPSEAPERPGARTLGRARGAFSFRAVSFAYDPARPVLSDVTFDVPAGARVGIAGRTGSGKTTLLSLLPRFYDPTAGEVRLDGVDLRDLSLASLRAQFAIVLQEPVLFSTTIGENIAYGRPGATQAEIEAAAKAANVHDFVASLPQGYDTPVGERGMKLSGGERQRLSIARAFLRDAPILILDEPTSSVDRATEQGIIEAFERLMQGRTSFLIAHRTSTLEGCDLRVDVEEGRVRVREAHPAA